jgi:hypothetical protein
LRARMMLRIPAQKLQKMNVTQFTGADSLHSSARGESGFCDRLARILHETS